MRKKTQEVEWPTNWGCLKSRSNRPAPLSDQLLSGLPLPSWSSSWALSSYSHTSNNHLQEKRSRAFRSVLKRLMAEATGWSGPPGEQWPKTAVVMVLHAHPPHANGQWLTHLARACGGDDEHREQTRVRHGCRRKLDHRTFHDTANLLKYKL